MKGLIIPIDLILGVVVIFVVGIDIITSVLDELGWLGVSLLVAMALLVLRYLRYRHRFWRLRSRK